MCCYVLDVSVVCELWILKLDPKPWGVMPWVVLFLFMFRPRLLLSSAGSGVNRVLVVLSGLIMRLLCCVKS